MDNTTAVNVSQQLLNLTSGGDLTARDLTNTGIVIARLADSLPTLDSDSIAEVIRMLAVGQLYGQPLGWRTEKFKSPQYLILMFLSVCLMSFTLTHIFKQSLFMQI